MRDMWKRFVPPVLFFLSAIVTVVLTVFCMSQFRSGFLFEHAAVITSIAVSVEVIYIAVALIFMLMRSKTVFKFMLTGIVIVAVLLLGLMILQLTGILDKVDSIEDLRALIESTGPWGPIVFIIIQMLQVFLLPLPGVLTVGAGVAMFGEWFACLYSYIGIVLGSLIAFWIGRVIGYRAAAWLVGRESLDKWLHKIKGKDKSILTVMFILPIFPDDLLCFVSGLTTMSWKFFIIMQLIARALSVVMTSFSLGGSIIPYNTWWGILLWLIIAAVIIAVFILIYKKGEKIERWFFSLFKTKKHGGLELKSGDSADGQTAETVSEEMKENPRPKRSKGRKPNARP